MTVTNQPRSDRDYYRELFPPKVRWQLAAALLGSVMVSLLETGAILLLLPMLAVLNGDALDVGILGGIWRFAGEPTREAFLVILVITILLAFVVKDVATIVFRWWMAGFNAQQNVRMSTRMLSYFLHSPYEAFRRRGVADILRVVGSVVNSFYFATVNGIMSVITEAIGIIAVLLAIFLIMPWHTVVIGIYFGIIGWSYSRWVKPRLEVVAARQLEAGAIATGAMLQSLGGIEEIKIRHAHDHFVERVRVHQRAGAEAGRMGSFLGEMPKYLLEIMFILGLGVLIVFSLGQDLLGTIALLAAAAFRLLPAVTRLMASMAIFRGGEPARKILLEELRAEDTQGRPAEAAVSDERLPLEHELRVDNVAFAFQDSEASVLKGVSFTVPAGSSTALVGGSGAGKTTLGNLLLGLLNPTSGRILVDGEDIANNMSAWQNCIGFVPQDVYHLDLPFDENIAFNQSADEVDEKRLWAAVDAAQLRDVIEALPQGVKTWVGDRAVRLSGGQRQRVGLARALYRNPDFLLLDEATSALDNETERQVTDTLTALRGKLTTVVIAHRLSTVRDVDQIILLEDGLVSGVGTFEELARSNDYFKRMVELGRLD